MDGQLFLDLGALSDAELVAGLNRVVGSGRRLLAELLAHLCEVEDRRLHLDAGYPSLFAYCMARLGFTEDEAYRRINVARLARKAPVVFNWIAEGRLSLSVAALLQPYVLAPNLRQLIEALAGKSVKQAREALVAFFPRPDIVTSIRKLPRFEAEAAPLLTALEQPSLLPEARRAATDSHEEGARETTASSPAPPPSPTHAAAPPSSSAQPAAPPPSPTHAAAPSPSPARAAAPMSSSAQSAAPSPPPVRPPAPSPPPARPSSRTEPLSPGRYKIQFTADAALKDKLELARDLLRHAVPNGDLALILHRALDLLLTDLQKRRFGATRQRNTFPPPPAKPMARETPANETPANETPANETPANETPANETPANETPANETPANETPANETPANETPSVPSRRAMRRAVSERDGCRCTWRGTDGVRCTARAWLEQDHRMPRALGGVSSVQNLRLLCRAHNRRAAELVFGKRHIEKAITRARRRTTRSPPART